MGKDIIMTFGKGSGGTYNYNALRNKPVINGLTVEEDREGKDYNLQDLLIAGDGIEIQDNGDHTATIKATGSGAGGTVFVATYNVTTAEEILAFMDSTKEPFAPILVKRGEDYYTAILAAKSGDKAIIRVIGSGGGDFHVFTYTVTGSSWANSGYTIQKKLVSGVDIKTINGKSILGSGDIPGFVTDTELQTALADKADKATTYTKAEVDARIPDVSDLVTDTELQTALAEKADKTTTYTKTEVEGITGSLSDLTTDTQANLVAAINEVYEKSGEPFRVKNWANADLNVSIPYCTEEVANTSIAKMTYSIDAEEGASYQIVGMIAYEIFDSSNQRINCWPVCQFTGNGQKELSVRWACMGSSRKTATKINAWVLLKHR